MDTEKYGWTLDTESFFKPFESIQAVAGPPNRLESRPRIDSFAGGGASPELRVVQLAGQDLDLLGAQRLGSVPMDMWVWVKVKPGDSRV